MAQETDNQNIEKEKIIPPEELKGDVFGFRGGLDLDLDKITANNRPLRDDLSDYLCNVLRTEIKNQEEYVNKIPEWQKLYRGTLEKKSFPFPGCANVSVPVLRIATDTLFVRQIDSLWNKEKLVLFLAKKEEYSEQVRKLEEAFDWFQVNVLRLRDKLMSPLLQSTKIGTGVLKIVNEEKRKIVYRYAKDEEKKDKDISKFSLPGTSEKAVKIKKSEYVGPNVYPISREDWIQSSDSIDYRDSAVCGFRYYLRPAQVRLKVKQGLFYQKALDKLMAIRDGQVQSVNAGSVDTIKELRAQQERQQIKTVDKDRPIPFYELWVRYDVDEDGEEDDIRVEINLETGVIMKAIYNPLFGNFRPFKKFIFSPVEYSKDGEGTCQILESIQNEINTLHNQRIDRITQINLPMLFALRGHGLEEQLKSGRYEPGKVYWMDSIPEELIKEFNFSNTVFSSFQEEDRLIDIAFKAIGVSPIFMGQSTAERPVAKETMALIEELNKKFKYGQENIRQQIVDLVYDLLEFMGQYQPTFTYYQKDEKGFPQEKTVDFPAENLREVIDIRLVASSEIMNQATRREVNVMLYQILSDYMTKAGGMGQVICSPQAPSNFKKILIDANDIGVKILTRIIEDYPTVPDARALVLDLTKSLTPEELQTNILQSADIIQEQQQQAQMAAQMAKGQPPQGPPTGQEGGIVG